MKYGALAKSAGEVHIVTELQSEQVIINWTELGGPEVKSVPERTGFGTQLSEIGITSQLGGSIERVWSNAGLQVIMTVPTAHL